MPAGGCWATGEAGGARGAGSKSSAGLGSRLFVLVVRGLAAAAARRLGSPRSHLISPPPGPPGSPQFDTLARFRAPYSRGQDAGRLLAWDCMCVRACGAPYGGWTPPFYAAPAPLFPAQAPWIILRVY